MDPASLVYTLNINAPETWNAMTPVVLPTQPFTIAPILGASMGVFVPFVLFIGAVLTYLYRVWHSNTFAGMAPPSTPSSSSFNGTKYAPLFPRGRTLLRRAVPFAANAASQQQSPGFF